MVTSDESLTTKMWSKQYSLVRYGAPLITLYHTIYVTISGALCNRPMGMQNGRIPNSRITASSNWDRYHASFRARLHHSRTGRYVGAWCAKTNNRYQWLQVQYNFTIISKVDCIDKKGRLRTSNSLWSSLVVHKSVTKLKNF